MSAFIAKLLKTIVRSMVDFFAAVMIDSMFRARIDIAYCCYRLSQLLLYHHGFALDLIPAFYGVR